MHCSPCLANTSPDTSNTVIWQEHFSEHLRSFLVARTSFHQKYSPRTMFVFKIQLCLAGCAFTGWGEIKGPVAWLGNSGLFSREAAHGPEGRQRKQVCSCEARVFSVRCVLRGEETALSTRQSSRRRGPPAVCPRRQRREVWAGTSDVK